MDVACRDASRDSGVLVRADGLSREFFCG